MTYDEMVNGLVKRYRNGEFPGWTMTDDDYAQMRRITKDGRYEFVCVADGPGTVELFHEVFSIDDYSDGELWFYGSAYYQDQDEFMSLGADIMAECVFEQTAQVEMCAFLPETIIRQYLKIVKEDEE